MFRTCVALAAAALIVCSPASSEEARTAAPLVFPETTFSPLLPCRVFDTRQSEKFAAKEARVFQISGDAGFVEQGGQSGGCGVPPYALSVSLTVTATKPDKQGFVSAAPSANYPQARMTTFQRSSPATGHSNVILLQGKLAVSSSASAHVTGEVTGFYAPTMWAMVRPEGDLYMYSGRFKSARRLKVGEYEVTADREIHKCGSVATVALQNYYATALADFPPKSFVTVKVYDASGQPADAPFTVLVTC